MIAKIYRDVGQSDEGLTPNVIAAVCRLMTETVARDMRAGKRAGFIPPNSVSQRDGELSYPVRIAMALAEKPLTLAELSTALELTPHTISAALCVMRKQDRIRGGSQTGIILTPKGRQWIVNEGHALPAAALDRTGRAQMAVMRAIADGASTPREIGKAIGRTTEDVLLRTAAIEKDGLLSRHNDSTGYLCALTMAGHAWLAGVQ